MNSELANFLEVAAGSVIAFIVIFNWLQRNTRGH